jgi:hypothetical protein
MSRDYVQEAGLTSAAELIVKRSGGDSEIAKRMVNAMSVKNPDGSSQPDFRLNAEVQRLLALLKQEQLRTPLVLRVRSEIERNTYETDEKLDKAIERLLVELAS